ncbi:RagB/SusD family nutrient uptake outer membrane protein [Parabacteroides sp. OttesenSCG-928-G06]|nr:RagB/SusD family nutrient uptake outer membrane protein [Parabacteroides sp. OttesenSCG-928-G06]
MKKKINIIIIIAFLAGSLTACMDLLDTAPYNALASGSMWQTEESVDQGVTGVYNSLRDWAQGVYADSYVNNNTSSWGNGSTYGFERWGIAGQLTYAEALTNGTINTSNSNFSTTWRKLYEGVHRANEAIANIPQKSPASPEKNARLIAELKFLRAYFYFRLNELYGRDGLGVPLYTEPVTVDECINGQAPESEVWAQIIKDLTEAIEEPNLPNKDNTGRVNKGAAYALRGKAYLYQGAKYDNNGSVTKNDELLQKAVADFDKVGQCGFSLFGDYKSLFSEANENCDEMILSIPHTSDKYYGTSSQLVLGNRSAYSATGEAWATLSGSPTFMDIYENADGTPFHWDDIIPGYSAITEPADRIVYFLRDTLDAEGNIILQAGNNKSLDVSVRNSVVKHLKAAKTASVKNDYLPYGNEARMRSIFENRDPRLEATFVTPYAGFIGGYSFSGAANEMEVFWRFPVDNYNAKPDVTKRNDMSTGTANGDYVPYFFRKFVYEGAGLARREDGPLDEPLIRYANVLLWQAEAYVELNQLDKAEANVRRVRDRAGVETLSGHFADQSSARNYVRDERRREFAGEGVNFFDEMHWRTWNEAKFKNNKNGMQSVWGNIKNPYKWAGDHIYIWPVPQTEIEKNPNLKKTPGWNY